MMPKAAAIYLRLSQEDVDLRYNAAKDESNSIAAQRRIIVGYIENDPELCTLPRLEFCDDGFSGTNFTRPDFQRMIELAKQGEIGCIVVKDLSRFGRDYLEVGDYLEHIFPFLGIRFISVNDNYDSFDHFGKTAGMDITFRNLVYDYYSKDLSVKVKTAMQLKQQKGAYISCCLYGYKTSPRQKHQMIIDEPAAEIVREIFDAVIAGKSTSAIAADLNARGIPTPQEYKGVRRKDGTPPQWTHPRIADMIRNIKYAGVMTNHTRESRHIRDRNQRRVPMEEWIITPDAHEAIIPREKWDLANEMLGSRKKGQKSVSVQPDRVYYCAHCGRKLRKTYGSDEYYSCTSSKYQHESECAGIRLKRSEMEDILVEALRAQIKLIRQSCKTPKKEKMSPVTACYQKIMQTDKEIAHLRSKKLERYEAYRSGNISREMFLGIKEQITAQTDGLQAKKEQLENEYRTLLQAKSDKAETKSGLSRAEQIVTDIDAGLREHLYDAINRVIVTTNEQIEIEWAFADSFAQKAN